MTLEKKLAMSENDEVYELTEDDFSILTEADLAMLKLIASLPPDDFDYSELWGNDDE